MVPIQCIYSYLTSMRTYDKVVSASSSRTESRRRIRAEAKRRKRTSSTRPLEFWSRKATLMELLSNQFVNAFEEKLTYFSFKWFSTISRATNPNNEVKAWWKRMVVCLISFHYSVSNVFRFRNTWGWIQTITTMASKPLAEQMRQKDEKLEAFQYCISGKQLLKIEVGLHQWGTSCII